jgi:hypothetical protein
VNVYLWDAGRWCGIAKSDRLAVAAAEACMAAGDAPAARVEEASIAFDKNLQPAYARLGSGWTATAGGQRGSQVAGVRGNARTGLSP